jgi:hypothetical protein
MDLDFAVTAKPFAGVVLCCTGVDHDERVSLLAVVILKTDLAFADPTRQLRAANGRGLQGRFEV